MSVYCQKIQISFDVHFYEIFWFSAWAYLYEHRQPEPQKIIIEVTVELIDAIVKADDIWLQLIVSREGPEVTFFI